MKNTLQILLIEDDQDDVELFLYALRATCMACTLNVVRQGNEVMPYLQSVSQRPDVIVLDLNLPMVNGRELLTQIKADPDLKVVPVAILTTSSAPEDRLYCLQAGANDFITKPTTIEELGSVVKTVIQLGRSRD
ncbi:response regulator [Spirosoma taeanense]|uniref:Response regulator n=1 Tax=Spirosoma taeanense TaxID=2735870 RepID=A0A6M5YAU7_9BACT|nr:response regulator [Spirosoma taeanense]QJW90654.1 response regulator [Spirosoma taeanense]